MLDTRLLKKIPTRYDASKVFSKGKKIYYYFSPKDKNFETFIYYLFNPCFSFQKNFDLLQKKFEDIKGYWSLYSDGIKYPPIVFNQNKIIQLELFN